MKTIKFAAVALALAAVGSSNAAVITFQTGSSAAGFQADADAYASVVNAAVASSHHSTVLSSYDNVNNNSIFGGSTDIAFKSIIDFGLSNAGTYSFRAGVDFGRGGAVFLDGQAVALNNSNDMWWAGSYGNTSSIFQINSQALSAGNHTLTIYGLEGCCDGGQQVQYAAAGNAFQSFSVGTLAPVPEPETYAMLLGGLALVGGYARRRNNKA